MTSTPPSGTVTFLFTDMEYDPYLAQLRSAEGQQELSSLWAEGWGLTLEQAIQLALA